MAILNVAGPLCCVVIVFDRLWGENLLELAPPKEETLERLLCTEDGLYSQLFFELLGKLSEVGVLGRRTASPNWLRTPTFLERLDEADAQLSSESLRWRCSSFRRLSRITISPVFGFRGTGEFFP